MTSGEPAQVRFDRVRSPLGPLLLTADSAGRLTGLFMVATVGGAVGGAVGAAVGAPSPAPTPPGTGAVRDPAPFDRIIAALEEYFSGRRTRFTVPVAPEGTAFQRAVWAATARVPYGERRAYGDIAAEIGRPSTVRAVAAALGRNPISIIIPCHRVGGADGSLGGFGGRLLRRRALADLEAGALLPLP